MHDLSKYSPTEFLVGARYFQGDRSPNNAEREAKGYSSSWLHHKGRNKHHFEYWIDYTLKPGEILGGMKMPVHFVVEMFMDRIAACKVYQKRKLYRCRPGRFTNKQRVHKDASRFSAAAGTLAENAGSAWGRCNICLCVKNPGKVMTDSKDCGNFCIGMKSERKDKKTPYKLIFLKKTLHFLVFDF